MGTPAAFGVALSYFAKLRRFFSDPSGWTSNASRYSPFVLFKYSVFSSGVSTTPLGNGMSVSSCIGLVAFGGR